MKTKFSEKNKRFEIPNKNRNSKIQKSIRKNSLEKSHIISNDLKMRSKSKDEIDILYFRHVDKVKEKYQKILKKNPSLHSDLINELKRCEECHDFINDQALLICDYCEDGYHIYCLNPRLSEVPNEDFTCPKCKDFLDKKIREEKRQTRLEKSFSYNLKRTQKKCFKCLDNISETNKSKSVEKQKIFTTSNIEEKSLKSCFKCQKHFHLKCFRTDWENLIVGSKNSAVNSKRPKCRIICDYCETLINKELKDTRMTDYFKLEKNTRINQLNKIKIKLEDHSISDDESTNGSLKPTYKLKKTHDKKSDAKFKLPKELNKEQKDILQKSLFRALKVKNIEFDDNLIFNDSDCTEEMNNSELEVGTQKINEFNKNIYYCFKKMTNKAEYPPLEIVDDDIQGFIVRATDDIPIHTLICEYTGDVTFARKKIFDKNDSIMNLLITPSSSTSLVICPENKGNIARFISGINNYDTNSQKKQNINSIKYDIDGSNHILLYAARTVKKNETLYYDYNAGGESYPTHYFV